MRRVRSRSVPSRAITSSCRPRRSRTRWNEAIRVMIGHAGTRADRCHDRPDVRVRLSRRIGAGGQPRGGPTGVGRSPGARRRQSRLLEREGAARSARRPPGVRRRCREGRARRRGRTGVGCGWAVVDGLRGWRRGDGRTRVAHVRRVPRWSQCAHLRWRRAGVRSDRSVARVGSHCAGVGGDTQLRLGRAASASWSSRSSSSRSRAATGPQPVAR